MEGTYHVMMGNEAVGEVIVKRCGLYFHFSCRCQLSGEVMQYLSVNWDGGRQRLGLLTPMDGVFGLEKRMPVKLFGRDCVEFRLQPKHPQGMRQFYLIHADEPFAYLHRLEHAYLAVQNQQPGLVFQDEK